MVIKDGRVVEQGDHDELIRGHRGYHDLCASQFTEAPARSSWRGRGLADITDPWKQLRCLSKWYRSTNLPT